MQAGTRRWRVRLQRNDAGQDTLGQDKPANWVSYGPDPIWARRIDIAAGRGSERFTGGELLAEAEVAWEIPYSAASAVATAQHQVLELDSNIGWEILHVVPIGYRKGLRLITKARVD